MGTHSYQWDAEGRLKSVDNGNSQTYVYNALGQRVQASGSGVGAYTVIQDYDAFGNLAYHGDLTTWGNVPFPPVNGKVYGEYYGLPVYLHTNTLDSVGVTTHPDGSWLSDEIYDPWGQRWALWNGLLDEQFAGMQMRDAESGLDQTPNRMFTSQYGRWMSPDPLAGDITNPQSLNRYAYVMNNPMSAVDPLGLGPPQGGDPCGNHPYKAVCGGDAASSEAACLQAGLTPNCAGPFGSGELAAAEAQYNVTYNISSSATYIQNGVNYLVVPGGCVTIGANPPPCHASSTTYAIGGGSGPGGWGLAWVPGLAPGANGLVQALKAAANSRGPISTPPNVIEPPPGVPNPTISPTSSPEDPVMAKIMQDLADALSYWIPVIGGPSNFSPIPVITISPCLIHNAPVQLQSCRGSGGGGLTRF